MSSRWLQILLMTCAGFSVWKAMAGEAIPDGNPFRAYPWFPIPDALTREQPDGALAGPPSVVPPPYALFRDADYDPAWGGPGKKSLFDKIKLIPLDRERLIYLTFGGEIRERFEYWNNENFGVVPGTAGGNAFWLQRIMLHMDLRVGPYVRFFIQGESNLEEGRKDGPRPPDVDQIDVHQAFTDITMPLSDEGWVTLRSGRQELGYGIGRLIDPREGPNVRLSFDGAKAIVRWKEWEMDAFWTRLVETEPYEFDESTSDYQLWGVYLAGPWFFKNTGVNFYYLGDYRNEAPYFSGVEIEVRHSFGSRIYGKFGDFDFDFEGAWQTGTFGPAVISAWFGSGEIGYSFSKLFGTPHLALKADIFSGNNSQSVSSGGRTLGTFNALFPRGNYFSEPSPLGEQNLIALHPQINWYPAPKLGLAFSPIFYWRQNMNDGIYNFAGFPLFGGAPGSGRYVGTEFFFQADYQISEQLKFSVAYDHFIIGDFFKNQPGAANSDWVGLWATMKF